MKKILIIAALFFSLQANSQHTRPSGYTSVNARYLWESGLFNGLGLPAGTSAEFRAGQAVRAGALYYDSTGVDSGMYVFSGLAWRKVGSDLDTTSLSNRIDLRLLISDTTAMLLPYLYGFNNIGSTPNAQGASIASHLVTLQPADSSFGGVVSTAQQKIRGEKMFLTSSFFGRFDAGYGGYIGTTIVRPGSFAGTYAGLKIGFNTAEDRSFFYSRMPDGTKKGVHVDGASVSFTASDSLILFFTKSAAAPVTLLGQNTLGTASKITLGSGLALTGDVLSTTSPSTPNTIYSANDTLVDSRQVDMKGYSLEFLNSGLFRILDTAGTVEGTYDFNEGIDFVVGNTAKSLGVKADVINGILNEATNLSTGDISFIKTDVDSLILRNDNTTGTHFRIADYSSASAGYALKLADPLTGRVEWGAVSGATPTLQEVFDQEAGGSVLTKNDTILNDYTLNVIGNSSVAFSPLLSVNNSSTTGGGIVARSAGTNSSFYGVNTKTSSGGGSAFVGESQGSNATAVLTRDSSSTNTTVPVLQLIRSTSGSAANDIGASISFGVETTSGVTEEVAGYGVKLSNATSATKETQIDITGKDNSVTETFMNIQKDLVRINNNADTLATLADVRAGGGSTDTTSISDRIDRIFSLNIQTANNVTIGDAETKYFFASPVGWHGSNTFYEITILRDCTIDMVNIEMECVTAGTAEDWSLYVRNNTTATDHLIATVSTSSTRRTFSNNNVNVAVSAGDKLVIKSVTPTFATNPASCIPFGYIRFK